jgi:hypothetical protein
MGYFNKEYLEHHQILGGKWGKRNGPPYPLGKGDHSAAEKSAAKAAGIKVGKDSGKGSIENVKKKKAPLTEEEKRLKAEEARLKGDSKNINKYMDKLTTDELRDAQTRAQIKKSLAEEKQSKADKEKKEAMLSGDKEKVKEYATKMSYNELQEAMNKVNLMAELNKVPPQPTTMDKIDAAMKKVDKARDWMDKGLRAYDALAAINNTFNKDHQWPRAEFNKSGDKKDDKKESGLEKMAKKLTSDAATTKAENDQRAAAKTNKKETKLAEKQLKFEEKKYADQRSDMKKAEKEAKQQEKETENPAHAIKGQSWVTFNNYNVDVDSALSKKVDDRLTANENEMFERISSGNFNWDDYDIRKHTPS